MEESLKPQRAGGDARRWIWFAALLLGGVAALAAIWFAWDTDAIREWKENASPLVFFGAMAALPALGAPLTPFYVVAGATFGIGFGLLGSALALIANLSLCYFLARGSMRERLLSLMARFDYQLPNFERREGAVRFAMLVKLAPGIPAVLKNYLLGVSGVPYGVFLGVSLFVAALYAVPMMALGQSLFRHDQSRTLIALVVIVALVGGAVYVMRRQNEQRA
jgi:uncharacterized membrane protein YdjX (TVP38/TMEM64 family)